MLKSKWSAVLTALLVGCSMIPALAQESEEEYELTIGSKRFIVKLNKPITAKTADGGKVEIVLKKRKSKAAPKEQAKTQPKQAPKTNTAAKVEIKQFNQDNIKFNYPANMKVIAEKEDDVATVTAETEAVTLIMIQLYPSDTPTDMMQAAIIKGIEDQLQAGGAKIAENSGKTVKRKIGVWNREGKQLQYKMDDVDLTTEIYTHALPGKKFVVVFQHLGTKNEGAEEMFKVIGDSLE